MANTTTKLDLSLELERVWPRAIRAAHPIVVAVSGGPDSMALLHLLAAEETGSLCVAHVHHGLRGDESDRDARCVEQVCQSWNVPFRLIRLAPHALESGDGEGIEGRARRLRYDALKQVAADTGARTIATGHSRDDQVETVLHRIIRGTGVSGLTAMPMFREIEPGLTLARPLIHCERSEIEAYVEEHEIDFVTDSSNEELRFTRNRIRGELLPWLRNHLNPQVDDALIRLSSIATEYDSILESRVENAMYDADVRFSPTTIQVKCDRLNQESPLVTRTVMRTLWRQAKWPERRMGREQWIQLADFIADNAANGTSSPESMRPDGRQARMMLPYEIEARISGGELTLTDLNAAKHDLHRVVGPN